VQCTLGGDQNGVSSTATLSYSGSDITGKFDVVCVSTGTQVFHVYAKHSYTRLSVFLETSATLYSGSGVTLVEDAVFNLGYSATASEVLAADVSVGAVSAITSISSIAVISYNTDARLNALSNALVSQGVFSSNTAVFSSNALFPKTGGTVSGNMAVTGSLTALDSLECPTLTVTSNILVLGASNSGGVGFTEFPSSLNRTNVLAGNTSILGNNVLCVIGGVTTVPPPTGSTLYVKGSVTASNGLRVGDNMPLLKTLTIITEVVGSVFFDMYKTQSVTLSVPLPGAGYQGFVTYTAANDSESFVGRIRNRTTTSFTLVTRRVDTASNVGWGDTTLTAHILLVGV
jgi:hypothetical protein